MTVADQREKLCSLWPLTGTSCVCGGGAEVSSQWPCTRENEKTCPHAFQWYERRYEEIGDDRHV